MSKYTGLENALIGIGHKIETSDATALVHPDQANLPEWSGADVKITSDFSIRDDGFFNHELMVRTIHARVLTWIFLELRDVFRAEIHALNKCRFYGELAKAAIRHLATHQPEDTNFRPLLKDVLSNAFGFLEELRKTDSIARQDTVVYHEEDAEGRQSRLDPETGDETV